MKLSSVCLVLQRSQLQQFKWSSPRFTRNFKFNLHVMAYQDLCSQININCFLFKKEKEK